MRSSCCACIAHSIVWCILVWESSPYQAGADMAPISFLNGQAHLRISKRGCIMKSSAQTVYKAFSACQCGQQVADIQYLGEYG